MWFNESTTGMIGAIIGCLVGGIGGVMGTLSRLWAEKGKHRKAVKVFLTAFHINGIMLAVTGLLAICLGQAWYVWYAFLLPGALMIVLHFVLKTKLQNHIWPPKRGKWKSPTLDCVFRNRIAPLPLTFRCSRL